MEKPAGNFRYQVAGPVSVIESVAGKFSKSVPAGEPKMPAGFNFPMSNFVADFFNRHVKFPAAHVEIIFREVSKSPSLVSRNCMLFRPCATPGRAFPKRKWRPPETLVPQAIQAIFNDLTLALAFV